MPGRYKNTTEEISEEIRKVLRQGITRSRDKVLAEVRNQGIAVSNEVGRILFKIERGLYELEDDVVDSLKINVQGRKFKVKTGVDVNRDEIATLTRRMAREINIDIKGDPFHFTHMYYEYKATVNYTIYFYGDRVKSGFFTRTGNGVTEVQTYTRELLAARIETQLAGRIIQDFYDTDDSYIEGVDVVIRSMDFEITAAEGRGDSRKR